jgi:hypothetical protein
MADDGVMGALQAAHDENATASEAWHKQEHEFKVGPARVKKLAKWFHRRHREAYDRQHQLRRHIMRLGGTVLTNLGDTGYHADVADAMGDAALRLGALAKVHAGLVDAAIAGDDHDTAKRFQGHCKDLQSTLHKAEQKRAAIDELGKPLFVAKHS